MFLLFNEKGGQLGEKDILEKKLLMFNGVFVDFEDGIKSYFYCLIRKGTIGREGYFREETLDV